MKYKAKSIDWTKKGDISWEIYLYVKGRIDFWEDELEKKPCTIKEGIILAFKNVLEFIEKIK